MESPKARFARVAQIAHLGVPLIPHPGD